MDNTYFPHSKDGDLNKIGLFEAGFNFVPNAPISLDPRTVITEWTPESLKSLASKEVYAGLQIYCLSDKTTRICRWVPSSSLNIKFSGYNCLWDSLHTETDAPDWVDVTSESWFVKPIDTQIEEANSKIWTLLSSIFNEQLYCGFYEFEDPTVINSFILDDVNIHKIFNSIICNDNNMYREVLSFSKFRKDSTDITINYTDSYDQIKGKHFVVIVPKFEGKREITVDSINIGGISVDIASAYKSFDIISKSTTDMVSNDFDLFISTTPIPTGETAPELKATFTKVSDSYVH